MRVSLNLSQVLQGRWYEYVVRFFFGGVTTLCAGLIAKHFGPVVGGLFLGFPAIFPATATLVDKHQRERKQKAGIARTIRGRQAAAVDALGAAMGSIGLIGFGIVVWKLLPTGRADVVLFVAAVSWFVLSVLIWYMRKTRLALNARHQSQAPQHQATGRELQRRKG